MQQMLTNFAFLENSTEKKLNAKMGGEFIEICELF